ncbi:sensor histidine kinase [Paenibacillus chartarius]|uniref:histidine kinase n=1 Tax=Paenibacillus chartarius TaxID=747481 RepID=A0ABV6DR90_9BACL
MGIWLSERIAKFRFQRLRTRIVAAMIVISLPSLFVLGYISFNIAKETLLETNSQTYEQHLETSSEIADLLLQHMIDLNRSLVINNDIREQLLSSNTNQGLVSGAEEGWAPNKLQRAISQSVTDTRHIRSVCVMNLDFQSFCSGRSDDAGIYDKPGKAELIRQTDWYRKAVEAQGRVVFLGYDVLGDAKNTFSTVKLFRDAESPEGKPMGILIVNVSHSIFDKIFSDSSDYSGFMALEHANGQSRVVYDTGGAATSFPPGQQLNDAVGQLRDKGYLINEYTNQTTQWTFVHYVKLEELFKQSNRIGTATTIIASSMALLAIIISYILSGGITRPLLQIKKMMVEWTKGTRVFTETFANDEVGAIGETFKRMASENKELSERLIHSELKEREAELRALQAQIKPHFLYNTLDSIYWMAVLQKNKDIAQMAVSLSESFKLSLNKGKETITVYKELQHIRHYMTIQNIRYKDRFQYVEEVEESILGHEMMKLLLQPLVENAIYHGLEPKVGEGTIRLTGRKDGAYLVFTVEDNGVGIEDIAKTEEGYGLSNVRERMMLSYGPTSSLRIESEPGAGTKIEIRFNPKQGRRDADADGSRV